MKKIRLYGILGDVFGEEHFRDVETPGESVLALCATLDGFEQFFCTHISMGFSVFVDDININTESMGLPLVEEGVIKIVPEIMVAKDSIVQIFVGVALLVAAGYMADPNLAAMAWENMAGNAMFYMGASMIVGGVAGMLAAGPSPLDGSIGNQSEQKLYVFSGPVNTAAQGAAIPVLYGRLRVGSVVVSSGIDSNSFYKDHGAPNENATMGGNGDTAPWIWVKAPVGATS